ncbi:DNA helicase UvrD [Aphanothece hegewaldii CCALA 016]|uniref:DNA helicase UvrD n=1 Tax=Aphanothece hegewaldii CCALA 016 TaxID=2107694 RepID=A0A2T1M1L1_9CHRO|nr:UvrD-helicase domain-containing protein [Aphanothece hegewaldii]PSF38606.1 DNA helicase UvrD [Aphanothece hegewaldii CCALA 016]
MQRPIVIHPEVFEFVRTHAQLQEDFWKCLNKLSNFQFDSGLRVKKLKSISKNSQSVWEARVTISSRLIFTFSKSFEGRSQTYIAVHDLCLKHDDVNQSAYSALNQNPNSEWLSFDDIDFSDDDVDEILAYTLEEQTEIETELKEFNLDDMNELIGNIQWRVIESETEWLEAIKNKDKDLPLKLTPEEVELVNLRGNVILLGSAGTGKTTVGLYRLLKDLKDYPISRKRLYVAYNPLLVNHVREQFKKLANNLDTEFLELFEFKTIKTLCLDILKAVNDLKNAEDEIKYQGFLKWYRPQETRQYPAPLVWDEIRSIIKGGQLLTDKQFLSLYEYENLGQRRSSIISVKKRPELHKIAILYQNKLKEKKRYDEIDLARLALFYIQQNQIQKYHLIICDEVQDLTELQLELLMCLTSKDGHLLFAGDEYQMISPSGFRPENLHDRLHEYQRNYEEIPLKYNFRSIQSLVSLANHFLLLRARLLNETSKLELAKPNQENCARLVHASSDSLIEFLNSLNASEAILVRTEKEKETLRKTFNSSLIFTIEEAKGLEFDTVFIVNFFTFHEALWEKVINRFSSLKEIDKPALTLELNLLYVAITRARQFLYIWENNTHPIWKEQEIKYCTFSLTPELVANERQLEQGNWLQRGEYYMKAEFYQQAAECFKNAGEELKYKEAYAKFMQQEGNFFEAANLFFELEQWQAAAQLFERVEAWQKAANCWEKINDFNQQESCLANYLESIGNLRESADKWQLLGNFPKAAKLFEKVSAWVNAEICWRESGDLERANICSIHVLEIEEKWEIAAQQWNNLRRLVDERRCWMNSNNERKKAEYLAKDYEKQKKWVEAAQQYEIAQIWIKAITLYQQENIIEKVAECTAKQLELAQEWELAAFQYNLAKRPEKAQECFDLAAQELCKTGNNKVQQKDYDGALNEINKAIMLAPFYGEAYKQRGLLYIYLKDYLKAIADFTKTIELNQDPEAYYYRGRVQMHLALKDLRQVKNVYQQNQNDQEYQKIVNSLKQLRSSIERLERETEL